MELSLKHYGNSRTTPSTIIELIVEINGNTLVEGVTNLKGHVNASLIQDLRNIADELEEQNRLLSEKELTKNETNNLG